ncbi:MAG: enoyl-CoA hydratase-related protein [Actinomycetota bacterium]
MSILVENHDRVAVITLNDPDRRNTVTSEMNDAMIEAVAAAEADDGIGALVLTGAGTAFCAGALLDDLLGAESETELSSIYRGFLAVAHSSLPSIAAVNGAAVGAGMNLALAADMILAGESARFDSRFHQIAIHSGGGHTWRLANITNLQTAKAMVLFGERLNGQQAADVGLAYKCVPDDELLEIAIGYAQTAAAAPKGLVAKTKATFNTLAAVQGSQEAVDLETAPQFWAMQQDEFKQWVSDLKARISSKS